VKTNTSKQDKTERRRRALEKTQEIDIVRRALWKSKSILLPYGNKWGSTQPVPFQSGLLGTQSAEMPVRGPKNYQLRIVIHQSLANDVHLRHNQ
jgi:hypothetical protein